MNINRVYPIPQNISVRIGDMDVFHFENQHPMFKEDGNYHDICLVVERNESSVYCNDFTVQTGENGMYNSVTVPGRFANAKVCFFKLRDLAIITHEGIWKICWKYQESLATTYVHGDNATQMLLLPLENYDGYYSRWTFEQIFEIPAPGETATVTLAELNGKKVTITISNGVNLESYFNRFFKNMLPFLG